MKKIIAILLALIIVLSMATPALAVSPALPTPDMPEIPDLSDDIVIEIPDEVFDDWFDEHPMPPMLPIDPTCPTDPSEPIDQVGSGVEVDHPAMSGWMDWIREWFWRIPFGG